MADFYSSMTALYANEPQSSWNRSIRTVSASKVLVSAPHGGGIEFTTTDIADKVAGSLYNFHTFRGLLPSGNFARLHVTSTKYDCPYLESVNQAGDYTMTIHGASGTEAITYVGGWDTAGMELVKAKLSAAGFRLEPPPLGLSGTGSLNITNRNSRGKGIQIETTTALRSSMKTNGVLNHVFWDYVNALRAALSEHTAETAPPADPDDPSYPDDPTGGDDENYTSTVLVYSRSGSAKKYKWWIYPRNRL